MPTEIKLSTELENKPLISNIISMVSTDFAAARLELIKYLERNPETGGAILTASNPGDGTMTIGYGFNMIEANRAIWNSVFNQETHNFDRYQRGEGSLTESEAVTLLRASLAARIAITGCE